MCPDPRYCTLLRYPGVHRPKPDPRPNGRAQATRITRGPATQSRRPSTGACLLPQQAARNARITRGRTAPSGRPSTDVRTLASTSERTTIRITRCHAARREGCQMPLPLENVRGLGQLLPRAHTARGCMLRPASTRRTASRGHHSRKEPTPQRHVSRQITDVPADGRTGPNAIGHALRITRTTSMLHRVTRTAGREPPHHADKDDRDQHVPPRQYNSHATRDHRASRAQIQ